MNANLDSLRKEMAEFAASRGLAVFESESTPHDSDDPIFWDVEREPDYKRFLSAAEAAGVRLVRISSQEFHAEDLATLLSMDQLGVSTSERRGLERQVKELRKYEGMTGQLALAFSLDSRDYVFDLRTEWFDEAEELIQSAAELFGDTDDDEEDLDPMEPYFPRN